MTQAAVHLQEHTPDRSAHHQTYRNRCVEAVQQAGLPFAAAGQTPIAAEQIQLLVCTKHGSNQSLGTAEPVVQPLAVRQGAERTAFGQTAHFQPQTADTRQTHLEIIIRAAGVIHIGQRAARAACRVELHGAGNVSRHLGAEIHRARLTENTAAAGITVLSVLDQQRKHAAALKAQPDTGLALHGLHGMQELEPSCHGNGNVFHAKTEPIGHCKVFLHRSLAAGSAEQLLTAYGICAERHIVRRRKLILPRTHFVPHKLL